MRLSKTFIWFLALFGIVLFGYGLHQTRYSLRSVIEVITTMTWPLALYLGLGLVLVLWSVGQWRSQDSARPRWFPIMGLFGIVYLALAGASLSLHWKALVHHFSGDQTDPTRMAALVVANLDNRSKVLTPGDWPGWRGPLRDGKSTETGIHTDWSKSSPQTLWRRKIGGGYSSIAVVGDRLYTMERQGTQERIVCLSAGDGKELWAHGYLVNFSSFQYNAGPRATPTIDGHYLYSVGATGICLALQLPSAAGGQPKEIWRHDLVAEFNAELPMWGIACSPLVAGDFIIVQPGGLKGSIVALDKTSGKAVWSALTDRCGYSSPILAELAGETQIVAFTGSGVAGLRVKDGNLLWYFDWPEQFQGNIATPIAAGNFVFISSAYDNGGCALLEITKDQAGFHANPAYVKRRKLMQNHHSTCILHEGHLFGFDKSIFRCIDLRTATEKWASRKPEKGSLMYAEGHLITLSEMGELSIAKATPEKCTVLGKISLFDRAETWSVPVLSRGRLYVRDKEEIVCLDLRPLQTQ